MQRGMNRLVEWRVGNLAFKESREKKRAEEINKGEEVHEKCSVQIYQRNKGDESRKRETLSNGKGGCTKGERVSVAQRV